MAAPPNSRLQSMLQAAVQSVQWTYSLFWQLCPQRGILVWGDGYYNGAIKTRKTVQPMEVSAEEASLQRSQQLRELYESLSAGETNPPTRRPCASLSPEDLTESEWFYLMCVSFSFSPGVGLPGKAYARRQHVWLAGANEVESKTFSRAILAKSAHVQTVVCIPLLDGVVEFGTTDKVQEDLHFIQHVKSFFIGHNPPPPKPALSGHSTSNPTASSEHSRFHSPPIPPAIYAVADPPPPCPALNPDQDDMDQDDDNDNDNDNDDEEEEEEEEGDSESESEAEIVRNTLRTSMPNGSGIGGATAGEPSELMQLEMSEDIRVGSPDDGSNNLDSDFHLLAVTQSSDHQRRAHSTRRWDAGGVQPPTSGEDMSQEDTHYSQTVSTVLQNQPMPWPEPPSTGYITMHSSQSAFDKWNSRAYQHLHLTLEGTSQWLLKYILFSVPLLHTKYHDETSPTTRDPADPVARLRGKGTPQDELSANHVLAERRRREKLNERFIILRSLVPFVTKMDKASILGDTIEYVKQLRKKIQDLEARNGQMEADQRSRSLELQRTSSSKEQQTRSGVTVMDRSRVGSEKKKLRMVEGSGGVTKTKTVEVVTSVQVSIIESDALLELECKYREGLLLDVMEMLREMRIEVRGVQSSVNNGVFVAELRAKVKENQKGKKASIVEVKRALNQIIPHTD